METTKMKRLSTIFLMIWCHTIWSQQVEGENQFSVWSLNAGYSLDLPGGDLSERFGQGLSVILGSQYFTKHGWVFGLESNIHFGSNVKEDVLAGYRLDNGNLISGDGQTAQLFLRQRGLSFFGEFGKIISFGKSQSGLRLGGGVGWWGHKVRFLDEGQSYFQVQGAYEQGYNRLTTGMALKQHVGWEIHSINGRINGNIMFEVVEGFTTPNRSYQFDIGPVDTSRRLDLMYRIRATYMLPLMKSYTSQAEIYY